MPNKKERYLSISLKLVDKYITVISKSETDCFYLLLLTKLHEFRLNFHNLPMLDFAAAIS